MLQARAAQMDDEKFPELFMKIKRDGIWRFGAVCQTWCFDGWYVRREEEMVCERLHAASLINKVTGRRNHRNSVVIADDKNVAPDQISYPCVINALGKREIRTRELCLLRAAVVVNRMYQAYMLGDGRLKPDVTLSFTPSIHASAGKHEW